MANDGNKEWEKVYLIKGMPVKFVWRGNPYNDLKATVEGGNRDYVTVARIVASSPISQAEAEKLAGEKWRQIKKTARNANSRACNAAGYVDASSVILYPGDAVVFKAQYSSHKDDDEWLERNGDTVREVRGNEVKLGPSANDWAKKSDLMVWHNAARSRNDVLGRYKPGVRVDVELRTRPIVGKVMQYGGRPEVEYSPTTRTRFTGTLIKQNGDKWDIKSDSGEVYKSVSEADFGLSYNSRACNSTNPIVRKAMNAVARNFTPYSEFEVGDVVRFRDSVRSVPHDETYTVVKVSGKNITIKGGRDNSTSTEFANNLEIVENASTSVVTKKAVNAKDAEGTVIKVGDTVILADEGDYDNPKEFKVKSISGPYIHLDDGHHEYEKDLLVYNSRARNANSSHFGFFIGEQVVIKKDPSKKKYRVKEITETGDIRLEGATPLFDASELDTANYAGPYRSRNYVVQKALNATRNADNDFVQYYADSYSYIPKVGEIYKYDGKRVKCTSVQKLQRGNDDRDRFLVEGRVVG